MFKKSDYLSAKTVLATGLVTLLLSTAAWSDHARAPERAPLKRTFGSVPEFPAIAARYNVMGNVVARLHVAKDGHTTKTDIVDSPADFLSAVVVDATQDWQFINVPDDDTVLTVTFPFMLKDNDYPYDKKVRPQKKFPQTDKDVTVALVDGWAEFRLLIDRDGRPAKDPETKGFDFILLKSSSPEYKQIVPAMIAAMIFERSTENPNTNMIKAMNRFKVTVAARVIQIEQFSGD